MFRYEQTRRRNGKRRLCILDDAQLKLPSFRQKMTELGPATTIRYDWSGGVSDRTMFYFKNRYYVLTLIKDNINHGREIK